jgi:hypothetical protein
MCGVIPLLLHTCSRYLVKHSETLSFTYTLNAPIHGGYVFVRNLHEVPSGDLAYAQGRRSSTGF